MDLVHEIPGDLVITIQDVKVGKPIVITTHNDMKYVVDVKQCDIRWNPIMKSMPGVVVRFHRHIVPVRYSATDTKSDSTSGDANTLDVQPFRSVVRCTVFTNPGLPRPPVDVEIFRRLSQKFIDDRHQVLGTPAPGTYNCEHIAFTDSSEGSTKEKRPITAAIIKEGGSPNNLYMMTCISRLGIYENLNKNMLCSAATLLDGELPNDKYQITCPLAGGDKPLYTYVDLNGCVVLGIKAIEEIYGTV